MKTILKIIEETPIDGDEHLTVTEREIARVDIPPVGEPLKLLVALLQTVDAASKPPKVRKTRKDAGKPRSEQPEKS